MNIIKPLKVICINTGNSTKLIKGGIYSASSSYTRSVYRTLYIDNVGSYDINNFTLLNGDSLKNIQDFTTSISKVDPEKNDYTGQFMLKNIKKL